jgi:predicted AlkP superfamily phosphohydrolase/phosphomutase
MPWLKSRNYRIDVDAVRGRTDRRLFMQDLFETLAVHTDVMLSLAEDLPWDLFIGVITGTDRLHHFFFDAAEDPDHPFYADFMNYYSQVDSFFAKFLRPAGADTRLIVLSDHGFTRLKIQVYVNRILRNLGYLSFIRPDPQSLEEMHPQSKAFALDPNRIYLNSRDRFRDGVLDSAQKFEVRAKLKRELETMTLYDVGVIAPDGEDRPEDSLFLEVRTADEVYDGDCLSLAPDLVLIQRPGYDLKGAINVPVAARKDIFTGTHTRDDAFLIVGDGVALNGSSKAGITDVAGLIREILA